MKYYQKQLAFSLSMIYLFKFKLTSARFFFMLFIFNFVCILNFRVIEFMFSEVDKHIAEGTLIKEFKMSALPSLYEQFVQLIKYLVILELSFMQLRVHLVSLQWGLKSCRLLEFMQLENNQKDRDQVVILFQDMLEVMTRDIMMEDQDQIFRLSTCKSLCLYLHQMHILPPSPDHDCIIFF